MKHWTRASTTLAAAAAAGFLLWYAPHFHRWTSGGYWGVMALMAAAGVLIGLSQLHDRDDPTASFLFAFLPVLVAAGWVILASQPQGNWIRDHVLSWSGDMGIDHAVHNLGEHVAVVAFGLGAVFGLTFELKMLRRRPRNADVAPITVAAAASLPTEPVVDAPELEPPSDPSSGDSPDEP